MDFEFPIIAHCEACGWEWHEGRSTGQTKWNTLRNYCQEHAKGNDAAKAHRGVAFKVSAAVADSWLSAKRSFEDGAHAALTEQDSGMGIPAFYLTIPAQ